MLTDHSILPYYLGCIVYLNVSFIRFIEMKYPTTIVWVCEATCSGLNAACSNVTNFAN